MARREKVELLPRKLPKRFVLKPIISYLSGEKLLIICQQVKADSFFNFFSPPVVKEDGELENDDDQVVLHGKDQRKF